MSTVGELRLAAHRYRANSVHRDWVSEEVAAHLLGLKEWQVRQQLRVPGLIPFDRSGCRVPGKTIAYHLQTLADWLNHIPGRGSGK